MLKKFLLLASLLPVLAFGHGAPVIWNGTDARWLPSGLKSAGVCKLDSSGVMTSGDASLTADVSGILPLANGGTNKNMTAVNGGLVYSDADSMEVTSAGTSGQAAISGGTGAPTWFAPTLGSVLFAGTGGILAQDNSNFFWDDTNDRLGIGNAAPAYKLDITATGASETLLSLDPTSGSDMDFRFESSIFRIDTGSASLLVYGSGNMNLNGTATPQWNVQHSFPSTTTTLSTYFTRNQGLPVIAVKNTSSTANNAAGIAFAGNSNAATEATSGILGVHESHTGSAETGHLEFWTRNAGTIAKRLNIAADGTHTMSAYGAGVAHFDSSGVISSSGVVSSDITNGTIVNDDVNASAAIAHSKMAALSTSLAMATDGSGVATTVAGVTATELGYVGGLTSDAQTQIDGKQAADADLTAISALSGTNNIYYRSAANTWTSVTIGSGLSFSSGTLSSSGGITGFATIDGGDTDVTTGSYHCEIFTTTGSRTLTVSAAGPVMFALVGGGGGGAHGGGGGGGVIDHYWEDVNLTTGSYTVAIGVGGTAVASTSSTRGGAGGNTTFAGFTAVGGGGGGAGSGSGGTQVSGGSGGSGGGGSANGTDGAGAGGSGTFNKPEVQGFAGAASPGASGGCYTSSGGGGGGAAGSAGSSCTGGNGGAGLYSVVATIAASGTATYLGGGGGGGRGNSGGSCAGSDSSGGTGGGGNGSAGSSFSGIAGTANTGGGGGGGCPATGSYGGNGGSGKAIICARVSGQ